MQYYGWALQNRAALMPTREQVLRSADLVGGRARAARASWPSTTWCPTTTPSVPSPAWAAGAAASSTSRRRARCCPAMPPSPSRGSTSTPCASGGCARSGRNSGAFQAFRGTSWMPEPCRSCALREVDWGGCRCQAFALAGAAAETDPACELSPLHQAFTEVAEEESAEPAPAFVYRNPRARAPSRSWISADAAGGSRRSFACAGRAPRCVAPARFGIGLARIAPTSSAARMRLGGDPWMQPSTRPCAS